MLLASDHQSVHSASWVVSIVRHFTVQVNALCARVHAEGILVLMRLLMTVLCFATALPAAEVTSDGSRVHYESYGKGQEAVVFIHGWTCDLTFWRGQAPVYQKHRALLVDLPGHGQSEKPEVS